MGEFGNKEIHALRFTQVMYGINQKYSIANSFNLISIVLELIFINKTRNYSGKYPRSEIKIYKLVHLLLPKLSISSEKNKKKIDKNNLFLKIIK